MKRSAASRSTTSWPRKSPTSATRPVDEDFSYDDADPIAGRLVRPDEGFKPDDEADEIGSDGGWGGESAEEEAIHIEEG